LHSFKGKSCLSKNSLAIFDNFAGQAKSDPRTKPIAGAALEALVEKLKAAEPFLTTTKALLTSADRLDATAVNIMDAYYAEIDKLCEEHPILDLQPSRFMNFDEASLNNRGEYEKKDLTVTELVMVD
jgi:hypothetical protein